MTRLLNRVFRVQVQPPPPPAPPTPPPQERTMTETESVKQEYIGSKFFNNELEFWRERIRQHGVYTVEYLEQVKGLPFWAPIFGLTPENLRDKIVLEYGPAICPAVAGRDYKCTKL